jgi:NDP-sugar pyrophosphorylase family protein
MKALILAAGFGTRLRPFTENTPKPLFPIAGRPLLDILVHNLQDAGCEAIIINTHHLYLKIKRFIAEQNYTIPVFIRHEPKILGTGGAINNVADFWDDRPFIVINSDIVTDIDPRKVYDFHLNHHHPVTLVLHDDPEFNQVSVDDGHFITGFNRQSAKPSGVAVEKLAFTGIQVLDSEVLKFIPDNTFSTSIEAYQKLISAGRKIKAYIAKNAYWKDIGTPERYTRVVIDKMAPQAFKRNWPADSNPEIHSTKLKGDGSDRSWYRLTVGNHSLILADHGIRQKKTVSEIDAFTSIGRHLHAKGIPVPEIYLFETFAGLVFMEDLGDVNLQAIVQKTTKESEIIAWYKRVLNLLINMSQAGARDFDLAWTYQTPFYNRDLIFEKECRYFFEAFVQGHCGLNFQFEDVKAEFETLAGKALNYSINGFMHRDMQSRNIMVQNDQFYFIDFQGGRMGPIQYDIASLLIDPYVALPSQVQQRLLDYSVERLSALTAIDWQQFHSCYNYCALSRNLQILGAFGYLIRAKGKTYFQQYIPQAVKTLKWRLSRFGNTEFCVLNRIVSQIIKNIRR